MDLHTLRSTSASLIALLTGSTTEPLAGFVLISLGAVGRDMAWLVKNKTFVWVLKGWRNRGAVYPSPSIANC